MVKVHAPRA